MMQSIDQKELARILLSRRWECTTYTYDPRFPLTYEKVNKEDFEKWWQNKGNKVWFVTVPRGEISIKFDYERIEIWRKGSNGPEKFEYVIPYDEVNRLP